MKKRDFFIIIVVLLLLDLFSKFLTVGKDFVLIEGFLGINYVQNTGGIFGFFKNYNVFFIFLSVIVLVIMYLMIKDYGYNLEFAIIVPGVLGNLVDRVYLGYVRDFINIYFWPVFNLADMFLVVGGLYLLYKLFFGELKTKKRT